MLNIYQNFHTNGFSVEMLSIISAISILFGVLVINSKNPIVSVLFLIGLFISIASYLFCLGINFIGMAYLLVYVGAVSILFLFILMLINVRISELLSNTSNSLPLSILVSMLFFAIVYQILPNSTVFFTSLSDFVQSIFSSEYVTLYATSISWDKNLAETSHIITIGNVLYSVYSIWLVLTAIILLLAMVGAIAITIKQRVVKDNLDTLSSDFIKN